MTEYGINTSSNNFDNWKKIRNKSETYLNILMKYLMVVAEFGEILWKAYCTWSTPQLIMLENAKAIALILTLKKLILSRYNNNNNNASVFILRLLHPDDNERVITTL